VFQTPVLLSYLKQATDDRCKKHFGQISQEVGFLPSAVLSPEAGTAWSAPRLALVLRPLPGEGRDNSVISSRISLRSCAAFQNPQMLVLYTKRQQRFLMLRLGLKTCRAPGIVYPRHRAAA